MTHVNFIVIVIVILVSEKEIGFTFILTFTFCHIYLLKLRQFFSVSAPNVFLVMMLRQKNLMQRCTGSTYLANTLQTTCVN